MRAVDKRGWCVFEFCVATIVVGNPEYQASTTRVRKVLHIDEMADGAHHDDSVPLVSLSPSEFADKLHQAKFTGKGEEAQVEQLYTDFWWAIGVRKRVESHLRDMRRTAEDHRGVLRQNVIYRFGLPAVVSLIVALLAIVLVDAIFWVHNIFLGLTVPLGLGMCLAVQSDEPQRIRCVARTWGMLSLIGGAIFAEQGVTSAMSCFNGRTCAGYVTTFGCTTGNATFSTGQYAGARWKHCSGAFLNFFPSALVCFGCGASFTTIYHALTYSNRRTTSGTRDQMPPRVAHRRWWGTMRAALTLLALIGMFGLISTAVVNDVWSPSIILLCGWVMLCMSAVTPARRDVMRKHLVTLGGRDPVNYDDLALAALVPTRENTEELVKEASKSFRLLPARKLEEANSWPVTNGSLAEKTTKHPLGLPQSYFVSHSSHDNPNDKMQAFANWLTQDDCAKREKGDGGEGGCEGGGGTGGGGEGGDGGGGEGGGSGGDGGVGEGGGGVGSSDGGGDGGEGVAATPRLGLRDSWLWLDASCIDPERSTERNLALLPLYVGSCQKFLALVGASYPERLWCMVEVFCFLRMGSETETETGYGSLSATQSANAANMIVIPVRLSTFGVYCTLFVFDVKDSKCSKVNDKQRLQNSIEKGFGTLPAFNKLIGNLMLKALQLSDPNSRWLNLVAIVRLQHAARRWRSRSATRARK
jgi:uncharacterized membrane protein YgcG